MRCVMCASSLHYWRIVQVEVVLIVYLGWSNFGKPHKKSTPNGSRVWRRMSDLHDSSASMHIRYMLYTHDACIKKAHSIQTQQHQTEKPRAGITFDQKPINVYQRWTSEGKTRPIVARLNQWLMYVWRLGCGSLAESRRYGKVRGGAFEGWVAWNFISHQRQVCERVSPRYI